MDKEKVVEKIAGSCGRLCEDFAQMSCRSQDCEHCRWTGYTAEDIYDCVVRPEIDEVRKETEKRIYQRLYDLCTKDNPFGAYDLLKEDVLGMAKEDGVEIEECKTVNYENIEQSDVIELPCKIQIVQVKGINVFMYEVLWRSNDGSGFVSQRFFNTEPEADAFLAKKKTEKEKDDLLFAELKEAEGKFYDAFNRLSYKKRTEGKFGDADVDELLAAYERMCEIEKKRRTRK